MDVVSPVHPPMKNRRFECTGTLLPIATTSARTSPPRRPLGAAALFSSTKVNISIADFDVLRLLGAGANGRAYKVVDRVSGKHMALKVIAKSQIRLNHEKTILTEQQAFVRNGRNEHALQVAASFHDTTNFCMVVVSLCRYQLEIKADNLQKALKIGGDLSEQIKAWGRLPQDLAQFYAAELVSTSPFLQYD